MCYITNILFSINMNNMPNYFNLLQILFLILNELNFNNVSALDLETNNITFRNYRNGMWRPLFEGLGITLQSNFDAFYDQIDNSKHTRDINVTAFCHKKPKEQECPQSVNGILSALSGIYDHGILKDEPKLHWERVEPGKVIQNPILAPLFINPLNNTVYNVQLNPSERPAESLTFFCRYTMTEDEDYSTTTMASSETWNDQGGAQLIRNKLKVGLFNPFNLTCDEQSLETNANEVEILCAEIWPVDCNHTDQYNRTWKAVAGEYVHVLCPEGKDGMGSIWECTMFRGAYYENSENCRTRGANSISTKSPECEGKDTFNQIWTATIGKLKLKECPNEGTNQFASWECLSNGEFDGPLPDFSNCSHTWVDFIAAKIKNNDQLNNSQALSIANDIKMSISGTPDLYGHEISTLVNLVQQVSINYSKEEYGENKNVAAKLLNYSMESISLLLDNDVAWKQMDEEEKLNEFSNILDTINNVSLNLATKECFSGNNVSTECISNFHSRSRKTELEIGNVDNNNKSITYPQNSTKIKGEDTFITVVTDVENGTIFSGHIIETSLPNRINHSDAIINGKIISLTVVEPMLEQKLTEITNVSVKFTIQHADYAWGDTPQNILRDPLPDERPYAVHGSAECVFWDKEKLEFSSENCTLLETSSFSTTCQCNHLSTFALRMLYHLIKAKPIAVKILTISFALLFTVYYIIRIFLHQHKRYYSENDNENSAEAIKHFGIITSFGYVFMFFFVDKQYCPFRDLQGVNQIVCYRIGVLGHFLLLFMHLILTVYLLMATLQYLQIIRLGFVNTLGKQRPFLVLMGIPAAISLLNVATVNIIDYKDGPNSVAYGGEFCWLTANFIFYLYVPMWISTGVNFVLLGIVYLKSRCTRTSQYLDAPDFLRNAFLTNCLMFTTWLIGFFQFGEYYRESKYLAHVFPCMFAAQTVLIENLANERGMLYWMKFFLLLISSRFIRSKKLVLKNFEENNNTVKETTTMLNRKVRVKRVSKGVQVGKPLTHKIEEEEPTNSQASDASNQNGKVDNLGCNCFPNRMLSLNRCERPILTAQQKNNPFDYIKEPNFNILNIVSKSNRKKAS